MSYRMVVLLQLRLFEIGLDWRLVILGLVR